jgi:hypothetical protein
VAIIRYEIKYFKPFNKSTLRGFFTLLLDDFEIESFTYHDSDGKRWVGMPSKQGKAENGETAWFPLIRINDKRRYADFQRWAISEIKKILPEKPVQAPLPINDNVQY